MCDPIGSDGDADADADGDADTDADGDTDTDADGDSDADADADADGDADSDADGDADSDADGDADSDADGDADSDADGDADSDADGDADSDADGDADGDTDTDADADTDTDADNDTDTDTDTDADSDTDSDTDGDCTSAGMISNFEEGPSATPIAIEQEGRKGCWERFFENDVSAFKMEVVPAESDVSCSQYALRATGTQSGGWGDWVGIGVNLNEQGTCGSNETTNPQRYDASKYTGIRFRAKTGPGHDSKSAVRFNMSIPETEGESTPNGDYSCSAIDATTTAAARDCYQHMGRFLHVVQGYEPTEYNDVELTSEWKTFSFCFDRDFYPLSLPSNLNNADRESASSKILKLQFQFNQGKDWYVSSYPNEGAYTELAKDLAFDFYIDDIEFFAGECSNSGTFNGTEFPKNENIGSCEPVNNASAFNNALSAAYARWKKHFVQGGNRVVAVEQSGGVVTSESMGYGMLIAAMMGDQAQFDAFWGYVSGKLGGKGLMGWQDGSGGSATDGDADIAYALLVADAKWGGYGSAASSMIGAIKANDVEGSNLKPGEDWSDAFNPSYFAASFFRAFGGMDGVISHSYELTAANTGSNFPTDWADWSGNPTSSPGQVNAGFDRPAYGYDAARVPWRIGLDGCLAGGSGSSISKTIVDFFGSKYSNGETIDLMKAGWMKDTGMPATTGDGPGAPAKDLQGSFIGPLGVGAMAAGNSAMRERAFRTVLDILENPDFNHTYFPSTVGFITALAMSGNFEML